MRQDNECTDLWIEYLDTGRAIYNSKTKVEEIKTLN